jgi:hypothetical protein
MVGQKMREAQALTMRRTIHTIPGSGGARPYRHN